MKISTTNAKYCQLDELNGDKLSEHRIQNNAPKQLNYLVLLVPKVEEGAPCRVVFTEIFSVLGHTKQKRQTRLNQIKTSGF